MTIKVYDNDLREEIYYGDADEFLFQNDNDEELQMVLGKLETRRYNEKISWYGNQGMEFIFEKVPTVLYD